MNLKEQQATFAGRLRNPETQAAPAGIEERRLRIYERLFFNNIRNFISSGFPVLKSLHTEAEWDALVRDFYSSHKAQTPYFLEISEEFLAWLDNETVPINQRFPFARELAHYEWVELGLDVTDAQMLTNIELDGNLLQGVPVLSTLAWPLVYQWPVHLIGKEYIPAGPSPQPVCLVVYRNREDRVQFLEANPVTLRLLEIISGEPAPTGEQALKQLAIELPNSNQDSVVKFGSDTLEDLRRLGIIAGARTC